jgi:hypothetical protein
MSFKPTRRQLRVAMSGTAAVVVGATIYWATSRPEQPDAPEASRSTVQWRLPERSEIRHPQPLAAQANAVATPARAPSAGDSEESTIAEYTTEKYQYLLKDLRYLEAAQVEQLRGALLARERLAGGVDDPAAIAGVEGQIRALLRPADYESYETLRESDLELFKLNEYAAGISNVAPLSAADRESILKTKLAYKERFRQLLADSDLLRTDSSAAEREYAYSVTSSALEGYRRSYLQEVRQYLANEEQFALLSNYETTEFKAELARLRSMVDGSAQGGS